MGDLRALKFRRLIDRYLPVLVVLCVAFVLLGGALVYTTHVEPGTETQQVTVAEWGTPGEVTHGATVVNGTTVFPTGTTLVDRSMYYTQIAPVLDIDIRYEFVADGGELDVDGESTLVLRSVDEDGDELWRTDEQLDSFSATLEPDEGVERTVSVDVPELAAEVERIEAELGAAVGTTEIDIEHEIAAEATIDGQSEPHTNTYSVGIEPGGDVYTVETEATGSETHQRPGTVVTERTYGTPRNVSGPLLILVGVLGAIGLGVGRYRDVFALTDAERKDLEFAESRKELDDWISRARVNEWSTTDEYVRTDTLEDLVDIAIDIDERVIEDLERSRYYVFGDAQRYVYEPDADVDIRRFEK